MAAAAPSDCDTSEETRIPVAAVASITGRWSPAPSSCNPNHMMDILLSSNEFASAASKGNSKKLVMVGVAGLLWVLWNTRNRACFSNVRITSLFGVIKLLCYWLNLWSILQTKETSKNLLQWGTRLIEQVAREVFDAARGWCPLQRIAG